jgi:hypothetical protein
MATPARFELTFPAETGVLNIDYFAETRRRGFPYVPLDEGVKLGYADAAQFLTARLRAITSPRSGINFSSLRLNLENP